MTRMACCSIAVRCSASARSCQSGSAGSRAPHDDALAQVPHVNVDGQAGDDDRVDVGGVPPIE